MAIVISRLLLFYISIINCILIYYYILLSDGAFFVSLFLSFFLSFFLRFFFSIKNISNIS